MLKIPKDYSDALNKKINNDQQNTSGKTQD